MPGLDAESPRRGRRGHPAAAGVGPEVGDRGDADARLGQVEGDAVSVVVGRRDDRARSGADPVEADEPLRRRTHHDAREIVVAEHQRLLHGAGREHDLLRPDLEHPVAADQRHEVVGEPAVGGRAGHRLDPVLGRHGVHEAAALPRGRGAGGVEAGVVQRAAEDRILVDEDDLGAGLGGGERGAHSRRAAAGHEHVAEQVGLVEVPVRGGRVDAPQPRPAADQRRPEPPGAAGLVERLVVEPDGQEPPQPSDPGPAVAQEAAGVVLPADVETVGYRLDVRRDVRTAGELHQGVRIVARHGQRPARTPVLEGARQHPDVGGGERAGDRVAGEAVDRPPLEPERPRPRPVDQRSRRGGQAVDPRHPRPPPSSGAANETRSAKTSEAGYVRTISSVAVSRSAMNQ